VRRCPLLLCALLLLGPSPASAKTVSIDPSMDQTKINAAIASLAAGDTLQVKAGQYKATLDLKLTGTAAAPITVSGELSGGVRPQITASADAYQEVIRLRTGTAYLTVQNLHLTMTGSDVQAGIYFDSGVHHITIRSCEIENITGIGIQLQTKSDINTVLIESNHIHHTGTNLTVGSNGGQGFTAGGFDPSGATSGVYGLTLRHNLIHDTRGQEGDCAKLMYGVYASLMEDNVLYDCPRGVAQAENYGVTSYGSGPAHYASAADSNIIRRNLLYRTAGVNAGEKNVAIYAGPGTVVENNLVIQADIGIAARLESEVSTLRNLRVVSNTVYSVTDHAFSIRGTQTADASVVVANNALVAVNASAFGYRWPDAMGQTVALNNYYSGQDYAEVKAPAMIKLTAAPTALFAASSTAIPGADFLPKAGGGLIDTGSAAQAPATDFDLSPRPAGAGPDVGAYETGGSSHWALALDFKGSAAQPGADGAVHSDANANPGSDGAVLRNEAGQPISGDGKLTGDGARRASDGCSCHTTSGPPALAHPLAVLAVLALFSFRRYGRARKARRSSSAR
jgi:MYXO-CTERM domain-containing protein